jgi:predicted lipid-binding transport protein (Tim44 family)
MDIVFFVCLSLFFIFKLKNSLGVRNKDGKVIEKTISEFSKKRNIVNVADQEKVVVKIELDFPISDTEAKALEKISFNKDEFLLGVEDAVEVVSNFISKKDFESLKQVLSDKLYANFKNQIDELDKKEEVLQSQVIYVRDKKIESLKLEKDVIFVDVLVETDQMNYIENKNKELILGSKKDKSVIKEKWTFRRDVSSKETFWIVESVL